MFDKIKHKLRKSSIILKDKIKHAIPFLLCCTLLLMIICTSILVFFSNKINPHYNEIFSTSASMIATIFTISLTLIGIHHFIQNIPAKLLKYFLKSKFIIFMFVIYVISIIFNVLMMALGAKNIILVIVSVNLSVLCIMYLIAYFYHLGVNSQEISILHLIAKNLNKKRYNDEKYDIIKELIVKAIRDNNNTLYINSLNIIFSKEISFLDKISRNKISKSFDYDSRHSEVEKIINFFLYLQKQIFYEIINQKRQLFLDIYIDWMEKLQESVFILLAPRPYYKLRDHFNKIGEKILENRFDEIYLFYSHRISDITKFEYNNARKEEVEKHYNLEIQITPETKLQKQENILSYMMYESFENGRLRFLAKLSKKAIKEDIDTLNWFPKSILCNILRKAIESNENPNTRRILIQNIMYLIKQIYEENIKNNKFEKYFWLDMNSYIKSMKTEEDIKKIGSYITKEFCLGQLDSVKINAGGAVRELGVEGRFLRDDIKHNIVIKLLSETFDRILVMLSKKEIKNITKDYISYELHSILGGVKENNKWINVVIKKHKLKPSKNVYMMGIYMGTIEEWKKRNKKK